MTMLAGAISSDIDTLESIYRGQGNRRPGGYTYSEFEEGLTRFGDFLSGYAIRATMFMVGRDFTRPQHHSVIRELTSAGHEIANHTFSHAQGFRLLDAEGKERELARMEEACEAVTGRRPVGFRSPGWNVGDDALPILRRRGYRYDSSVFPTSLMPILKTLHWYSMRKRTGEDRTTMGHLRYMLAPRVPYATSIHSLGRRGNSGFTEFPITVSPVVRLPLFATFLLATGMPLFRRTVRRLRERDLPIQFMFHLSDFVDYTHPELAEQVPSPGSGQYVPAALMMPVARKLAIFHEAMDLLARDYAFRPLEEWCASVTSTPREAGVAS
jgi:hypothetical protein